MTGCENPAARCWICNGLLTLETQRSGLVEAHCPKCLPEIMKLQALYTARLRRRRFVGPLGTLTKYDWKLGKELWDTGLPVVEIAEQVGCGRTKVYRAAERYSWGKRGQR